MRTLMITIFSCTMIGWNAVDQNRAGTEPTYTSVEQATAGLLGEMLSQMQEEKRVLESVPFMVYGFRSDQSELNLDDLDQTLVATVEHGPMLLYRDPFQELMRAEMGQRPADKLDNEAMMMVAEDHEVAFFLTGDIEEGPIQFRTNARYFHITLALTEVQTGQIVWQAGAEVRLDQKSNSGGW